MANKKNEVKVGGGEFNSKGLQIVSGIVKEYFPKIGLYIVSLAGQRARCYSLMYSGGMGFGVYARGTYSPGEAVFCIFNEKFGEGYIIGAHPRFYGAQTQNISYPISGESTIGLNKDGSVRLGLVAGPLSGLTDKKTDAVQVYSDSHCSADDLMPGGSFSIISETGVCFFADPYSMGMQCDDATGLWVYSDDSYMRQASINFQQIAGGKVEEDYNDNGELNETVGHSMFSWELLGQTEKPEENTDLIKSDHVLQGEPVGSAYSVNENAKPFHRVVEYGGYLGHGYQRVVNAPPKTKPESYNYGTENPDQYCLSRISQFADGGISVESAKSIILAKHCYIPSIQTIQVPDDLDGGAGDSSKESKGEYDFSHEDVAIKSSPGFNLGDTTCELLQELAALIDYQAYLFNYKLIHPFVYHKKDYFVSEELSLEGMPRPQYFSWFSSLQRQQFAEIPDKLELDIHAKLKSTYYASESGLALLPEGGVSLYGGYGEEIRMGSGTSTLSAPGDIWIKAGRNIHLWAGNDIILKAKNCIDESATDGSVRIKAEKHLEMLGGNAESEGGVLIESKSSGDFDFSEGGERAKVGGLIIRASKGTAVFEGENTYICSGIYSGAGNLTVDAGQPNGNLNLCGGHINNYLSGSYFIANGSFDSSENGEVTNILYLQPSSSTEQPGQLIMAANIWTNGTIINKSNILCGGSIVTDNGCFNLRNEDSMVMAIDSKNIDGYKQLLDKVDTHLADMVTTAQNVYDHLSEELYTEHGAGNADRIEDTEFSYRTEGEYNVDNFKLYADRWQNIAYAMEGSTVFKWEEKKVDTKSNKCQYPYPGDKFYNGEDETCLVYQGSIFYNENPYVAYPRRSLEGEIDSAYTDAQYREPELKSLNEYLIIGGANG